jgi:hypothetical protein
MHCINAAFFACLLTFSVLFLTQMGMFTWCVQYVFVFYSDYYTVSQGKFVNVLVQCTRRITNIGVNYKLFHNYALNSSAMTSLSLTFRGKTQKKRNFTKFVFLENCKE